MILNQQELDNQSLLAKRGKNGLTNAMNGMKTANGIDKFLSEHTGDYELLLKNWQLGIRIL